MLRVLRGFYCQMFVVGHSRTIFLATSGDPSGGDLFRVVSLMLRPQRHHDRSQVLAPHVRPKLVNLALKALARTRLAT